MTFYAIIIGYMHKRDIDKSQLSVKKTDELILKLIKKKKLKDQHQLTEALKAVGVELAQSTLSRRLKKLNIVKSDGFYVREVGDLGKIHKLITHLAIAPPNLMVFHTLPGHAQALAFQLDRLKDSDKEDEKGMSAILGTIAGDDTVLLIVRYSVSIDDLKNSLKLHSFNRKP